MIIETERLILRELIESDAEAMFAMDSDPEVHKYLGNNPTKAIEETFKVIEFIKQQYIDNGIGRWAIIEKLTGDFVGWTGLKFIKENINNHINFYDVGYRLSKKYWGKGYATESAQACIKYAFEVMNLSVVFGITHIDNLASRRALEKCGLVYIETFMWQGEDEMPCNWLSITKEMWEKQNSVVV